MNKLKNKIFVYSDLHGNLEACEKIMSIPDYKTADIKVFCGDMVSKCLHSNEVVEKLFATDDILLMGNHDHIQAYGFSPEARATQTPAQAASEDFFTTIITDHTRQKLKTLKTEHTLTISGKKFLFMHYMWKSPDIPVKKINKKKPQDITKIFNGKDFDYVFYGHQHTPAHYQAKDGKQYYGVGSAGMLYPANYAVVSIYENGKIKVTQKQTPFNYKKTIKSISNSTSPRRALHISRFVQGAAAYSQTKKK